MVHRRRVTKRDESEAAPHALEVSNLFTVKSLTIDYVPTGCDNERLMRTLLPPFSVIPCERPAS